MPAMKEYFSVFSHVFSNCVDLAKNKVISMLMRSFEKSAFHEKFDHWLEL